MPAGYLLIIIAFIFIYLVLLRPQRRRQMEQARMLASLKEGDEVVTAGGLYGTITGFQDDDPLVEIAPELEVRVARRAIAAVTPPPEELEEHEEEAEEGEEEEAAGELEAHEQPEEQPEEAPVEAAPAREQRGYPGDAR
jgi:preprotein translocase subunit YajC